MSDNGPVRYKVAEAARLAGVSASTLRLWESQGLVVPGRSETGHRQYSADDVARLKRIAWYRVERGLNPVAIRSALEGEEPSAEGEASQDSGVGRRLRSLRHAAGKTLDQVAGDIGITASTLSTLERTSQGVGFKTLHDLADYYGTTVSRLSGEETGEVPALVRAGEWRTWPETTPGVAVQLLAEGRRMMDCHRFVLAPAPRVRGPIVTRARNSCMSCRAGWNWCSTAISSSTSARAIHFISKAAATIPGATAMTAKPCFSGSTRRRHFDGLATGSGFAFCAFAL